MFTEKEYLHNGNVIRYLVDYPANYEDGRKYPIIIYLHGYGFVHADLEHLKSNCPIRRERIPKDMPFIIVAPHCSETSWLFKSETLSSFFDFIISSKDCDDKKVYLCGSSMGAYASWWFLLAKKDVFAASVLCCGGGPYWAGGLYGNLPIKLVHGKKDETVLCRESEIMAERINEAGGNVEITLHDDLAHDVWTITFTNTDTYKWLLLHERKGLDVYN